MQRLLQTVLTATLFLSLSFPAIAQEKPAPKTTPAAKPATKAKAKDPVPPSLIAWKSSYAEALAEAKRTNKPLMVDFTSASCGWCDIKATYIDADPLIAKFVNDNFIPVKGAKDLGPVKTAFKPSGTPHTLLLSHDGEKLLVRIKGYSRPNNFMEYVNEAVELEKGHRANPQLIDQYRAAVDLDDTQFAQSIELLDPLIAANPKVAPLYDSRAWRLFFQGKLDAAARDYMKFKELAPNLPEGPLGLGRVYLAQGKFALAVPEFQLARKLAPRNPYLIAVHEVVALARAGRKKEADQLLEVIRDLPNDRAYNWSNSNRAALSTLVRGNWERFDEFQAKAYALERSTFYWVAGNLHAVRGDKTQAIAYLQKSFDKKFPLLWGSLLASYDLKALGVTPPPLPAPKPKPAPATTPAADAKPADEPAQPDPAPAPAAN